MPEIRGRRGHWKARLGQNHGDARWDRRGDGVRACVGHSGCALSRRRRPRVRADGEAVIRLGRGVVGERDEWDPWVVLSPRWIAATDERAAGPSRREDARDGGRRRQGGRRNGRRVSGVVRRPSEGFRAEAPGRTEEWRGAVAVILGACRVQQRARVQQPRGRVRRRVGRALASPRRRRRLGRLLQRANPARRDRPGERGWKPGDAPQRAQARHPAPADDPGPTTTPARGPTRARTRGGGHPRARGHRHGRRVHERRLTSRSARRGYRHAGRDRVTPRARGHATRARLRQAPRAPAQSRVVRRFVRGEAADVLPHFSRRPSRRG